MMKTILCAACSLALLLGISSRLSASQAPAGQSPPSAPTAAQTGAPKPAPTPAPTAAPKPATGRPPQVLPPEVAGVTPPPGYLIGVDDTLVIVFWRDKDMSSEVAVRPDGKITLPLVNDVVAAGLTPDQLREKITKEAEQFVEEPSVTVVVKQINSRKVYITGEVSRPGPYPLSGPTTVLQLIAMAGGLREYAHGKDIVIMRVEGNKTLTFVFDYEAVAKRKKLQQNILLKPSDTVLVP
jgi:polysaccharide export outer membrane protein